MKDEEEDVAAIATAVEEGRDKFVVPEELVVERPVEAPPPLAKNLQALIADMKVGERLKLALNGNRDARQILIRDGNRMVQRFVLKNPRVTEEEVIGVAKNRSAERELLEMIGKKKEWLSNYQVRLALVTNPKTPLGLAVRYVPTLFPRDLRQLAKSRNVASAVNGLAKRLILERSGQRSGPI